jgi:hypothetical protein
MATVLLPILWIAFDAAICLRTGTMSTPMSWNEIAAWGFGGLLVGVMALVAGWREREHSHKQEIKYEQDRSDLRIEIAKFGSFNQGAFLSVSQKLDEVTAANPQIQDKVTEVRAELAGIQKHAPQIVYDGYDEIPVRHGDGKYYKYTHLFFRNEPTGSAMLDAAARTEFLEFVYGASLFHIDAKWQDTPHDLGRGLRAANKIDLLANKSSHPLDLIIRPPDASDCFALHVESPNGWHDERYRLAQGLYRARVTLSCQGYSESFLFQIINDSKTVKVQELEQTGDVVNAKPEINR